MTLPFYNAADDPGPSFAHLLARTGHGPRWDTPAGTGPNVPPSPPDLPAGRWATSLANGEPATSHGTTVVAVRYADGVVMAGDRRATAGNLISHRDMEKVLPADRFSGVAFAGAAGPGMEMVKLFQLQLEHYEKVEGGELSLEGKANQLAQMVRNHLPAAMQGFVVVPLFAGYDLRRRTGRLFEYDPTGGRYEESDYAATGSGSLYANTVVKLGFREGLSKDEACELVINALFQAADEDSATGGPDAIRGIYPVVASISAEGFVRLEQDDVAGRFRSLVDHLAADRGNRGSGSSEESSR
jgi:proteasome beta subunit